MKFSYLKSELSKESGDLKGRQGGVGGEIPSLSPIILIFNPNLAVPPHFMTM